MPKREKEYIVGEIAGRLKKSPNVFVTTFMGLKATGMDGLRGKLEEAESSCFIIKNTLAKRALKEVKLEELDQLIEGASSITLAGDDPVKPAKILVSFAKEHEGFKIRGGYVAGKLLLEKEIKRLASLPSREILLGQVVGGMRAPIFGFVCVLNGLLRGLVCALDQIREKVASKEKEQPQEQDKTDPQAVQGEGSQSGKQEGEEQQSPQEKEDTEKQVKEEKDSQKEEDSQEKKEESQ